MNEKSKQLLKNIQPWLLKYEEKILETGECLIMYSCARNPATGRIILNSSGWYITIDLAIEKLYKRIVSNALYCVNNHNTNHLTDLNENQG